MKRIFLLQLVLFASIACYAYDIAVENSNGITIYYNYINEGTELELTSEIAYTGNPNSYHGSYSGSLNIPEDVIYMNHTRKVTRIGANAFRSCYQLTSVNIPNSVKTIGTEAFYDCQLLQSLTIPNSVTEIGGSAFEACYQLTTMSIPNSVTNIGAYAFRNCKNLTSVTISNSMSTLEDFIFFDCKALTSVTIPNSVKEIKYAAFTNCKSLNSITIPNSVTSIGGYVFSGCSSLTSVTFPNSLTGMGGYVFKGCTSLTSVTIPNSVTSIGKDVFTDCTELTTVISKMENPCTINSSCFSDNTFYNATLYVPQGTIGNYKSTDYWNKFLFIEEGDGPSGGGNETNKCAKPTISYNSGKLTFNCSTEGAICHSTISDNDIKSYNGNEVQLEVTYTINVYATKPGYENSETATATLCWIDVEPQAEGLDSGIAQIQARAVMFQTFDGTISLSGLEDNQIVDIYTIEGQHVASKVSHNGSVSISTDMTAGNIAIVKIGNKSIKLVIK